MSEWKEYKLSAFAELRREGFMPNDSILLPYIGLEHIEPASLILNGIGKSSDVTSQKSKFYPNDILYGKLRPYFKKVYSPNFEGVCSTDIFVIRAKNLINSKYLFYLLSTDEFTQYANSGSTGTRMPRADWCQLKKTVWKIPSLPTQTAIASILSSLDDKIELNNAINKNLEDLAQTLFKHWFVDFEFPNKEGKPYKSSGGELVESELGMIPTGWKSYSIGKITKVITGTTPSSTNPEHFGNYMPFVTPSDFKFYDKLIYSSLRYLSNQGLSSLKNRIVPKNSVIVTCIGSDMGKVAINKVDCLTNQQINSIVFKPNELLTDYVYYLLKYKHDFLRNMATGGSTMPIINKSQFEEIEIVIPGSELLKKFQEILDSINETIGLNIVQNQNLTKLRDILLPRLISGKFEINESILQTEKAM